MSSIIEDGRGTGNKALVDDHGRLFVRSNHVSHLSHHSTSHKNAYIEKFETTLAGASETHCALITNDDPSKDIEIYAVRISADANIEATLCVNDVYISGGNEIDPVNFNLSTNIIPTVTSYEGGSAGDLAVDSVNEKEIDSMFILANSPNREDLEGALVIPFSKSLSIKVIGVATNRIKVTITYALHNAGTEL